MALLYYWPPSVLRDPFPEIREHPYNPAVLQASIQRVLDRFCQRGGEGTRDDYVWSLYDTLGIPEGSLIADQSMTEMVKYLTRLENGEPVGLALNCLFTSFWFGGTGYLFMSDQRVHILPIETPRGRMGRRHEFHVEDDGTIPPVPDMYKLHVCVNHKYILYTILKLNTLRLSMGTKRPFQMKCLLNSRYSEINPEDTMAFEIQGNGGSVPPIVVYGSKRSEDIRWLFQRMNTLFSDEDRTEMGLMQFGDPTRIPPMNVRLNEMFAYALGDRSEKLTAYERNTTGGEPACRLPGWLLGQLGNCQPDSMQSWFGRPVCDRVVDGRLQTRQADGSIDPLCYLSLSAQDMIAPEQVMAVQGGRRTYRRRPRSRRSGKRKTRQRK